MRLDGLGILGEVSGWKETVSKVEGSIDGKDVSFDYGMDARTLKTIRTKTLHYSESAKLSMKRMKLDSTTIHSILSDGDVDFGKGNPRQTPCAEYYITGDKELENISLLVKRCDSSATIEKIIIE